MYPQFQNGVGMLMYCLLNILSISLLSAKRDTSGYFEMQQDKFDEFISPDEGLFERNM